MVSRDDDIRLVTERKIQGVKVTLHGGSVGWLFFLHANDWTVSTDGAHAYVTLTYTAVVGGDAIPVGMVPLHNVLAIRMVYAGESVD